MPHIPYREVPPEREARVTQLPVEIRATSGGAGRVIAGYGSVFGKRSQLLGSFVEIVDRHCWAKSAGDGYPGVTAKFNHDDMALLSTTASGSLRLSVDDVGLAYRVDLPDTSAGNDVRVLAARRDITGSSVGFQCWEDSWSYDDGVALRTLVTCRLLDCSPVVHAAYPDTTASLRSLARAVDASIEDVLDYAARDELRKSLVRTDIESGKPRPLSGRQAVMALLAKRWPDGSPIQPARPLSGAQAKMAIREKELQRARRLSGVEAQRILAEKYPPHQ
jgi:HK97 family phage prohead protease